MIAGIKFERASEAEVLAARALFERAFGGPASPERWLRKYFGNPAGAVVAFAARGGEGLVGFVGLHPSAFSAGGEQVTIYQPGDAVTDPAHQRRGILNELWALAGEWLWDHGAPFAISFPSAPIYELHKKTGHAFVGRLRRWVKPLAAAGSPLWRRIPAAALSGLASALAPTRGFRPAERLTAYDDRIDEVGEKARRRWKFVGVRGASFLEWRLPLGGGTAAWIVPAGGAAGYVVAERTPRGMWIRDLIAAEDAPATVGSLLAAVAAHAREGGAEHVTLPYLGTTYRAPLLRAGYLPLAGGAPFVIYEVTRPSPEQVRAANWLVTDADRDIACR
ncbi:MAG: GNAT family N-acetyltransferase [candidate division Zixibacteria bacterium]|nr:GNAT family N-acetyltransferase [candidate division Zixibacteria bacterium]